MFATIKNLIPEPRRAEQPRHYVGRHRRPDPVTSPAPIAPPPAPAPPAEKAPDEAEPAKEATTV